jgi:hypothetical protein
MAGELPISPSNTLMPNDKRDPVGVAICNVVQGVANGRFDERSRPLALKMA